MNLDTLLSRCVGYYQSGKSYHFQSRPGTGKTETMAECPAIIGAALGKNIGKVVMMGPLLTPTDTIGYLIPYKDEATGRRMSEFTKPDWWTTDEGKPLEAYDGGIIIWEEADKTDVDVKKALGEMAQSRRLGPHLLPPGWVMWSNGNRQKDRSGSTKNLDHLINRQCILEVSTSLQSWINWAERKGVNPVAITFTNHNANIVFETDPPKEQGPWPTPRSLVECVRHLEAFADADGRLPHDAAAIEEASGFIGHGAASQLMATIKLEYQLPRLEDIINDPLHTKVPSGPDGQMLVCYSLANRVDASNIDPVMQYVDRFPKDMAVLFGRTACNRAPELLDTPTFDNWTMANAALMQVVIAKKQQRSQVGKR